jgi:hypothetical protein
VATLLDILARELERPRAVSAQVVNHLQETHGIDRDGVGTFLVNELPKLEDFEVDLVLAPLFTPTLHDQAVFAELLSPESIPVAQWPALIQLLVTQPTCAKLVSEDGHTHSVPLRDVTIERFVNRLRLNGTIPDSLLSLIAAVPAGSDRPLLKAVARRAIWEHDGRRQILADYLKSVEQANAYRSDDVIGLLKLAETYEPTGIDELLAQIPHWLQVLRQEINEGAKPFFNERVEELHGGGRDQRRQDNSRIAAKEAEREFLLRLQEVLTSLNR